MRLLANENVSAVAVAALKEAGHEVVWVRTAAPGTGGAEVLAWAVRERRIVLTFDKDFGELAANSLLPPSCGVILLRLPVPKTIDAGRKLAKSISVRDDWEGHFSVIEPARVRMRPLT